MIRKRSKKDRDYAVGRGRPPKEHQFRPGQSGNKRGRPKGRRNDDTVLDEILHRKLPMRDRGRVRQVTVIEAILLKFTELALRGDPKAATFLLNRHAPPGPDETSADLTREDKEILEAFSRRIRAQPTEKKT